MEDAARKGGSNNHVFTSKYSHQIITQVNIHFHGTLMGSHENGDSPGLVFDVNTLMFIHGCCCRLFLRRLPWRLNAFLSSDKIMEEQISFVQYRINVINIGYKYTNSISASERNDWTNSSGGSGSKSIKNIYGTAICKGSL